MPVTEKPLYFPSFHCYFYPVLINKSIVLTKTSIMFAPDKKITLATILLCSIASFGQHDIAQWRGPERNGLYPGKNLLMPWPAEGPRQLWKYEVLGKGYSSAAVTTRNVYTAGSLDGSLFIFSFDLSGNLLWRSKLGPEWDKDFPGTRSTPMIYDELGYIVSGLGMLYCFDASNGKIKWTKNLFKDLDGKNITFGLSENLVIDGNKLFCTPGGNQFNVVALDRFSGNLIWKCKGNGEPSAYCSPILIDRNGKKYFVTMTANSLLSIDAETGVLAWKYPLVPESHPNTPIYKDGYLCAYDCSSDGTGGIMLKVSEDGKSATKAWMNPHIISPQGDGVLIGNNLYRYCPSKKKLYCFDWNSGVEKFDYPLNSPLLTMISADGLLYCYSFTGEVYLFKPGKDSFELAGKFILPGNKKEHCSHPVIRDGKLYIRIDNTLFVYSIEKSIS